MTCLTDSNPINVVYSPNTLFLHLLGSLFATGQQLVLACSLYFYTYFFVLFFLTTEHNVAYTTRFKLNYAVHSLQTT